MNPEEYVTIIKDLIPSQLKSVVLYGSAASGDFVEKQSDYNLLVVTESLALSKLKVLSKPTQRWVKAGNPAPLCFTEARLRNSADVFPLELLDIKECHKILYGTNILDELEVSQENLRHQLEFELKSKLIKLRERYLLASSHDAHVRQLLIQSLSTFLVLFRGTLRLYTSQVPPKKIDALKKLRDHIDFSLEPFQTIFDMKAGGTQAKTLAVDPLFEDYLKNIERIVDAVDQFLHSN